MDVLQLRNNNSEAIRLYHSGDSFTNFEQDKHFLLLIFLITLSSYLSFGLALRGFLYFYLNTVLTYKSCLYSNFYKVYFFPFFSNSHMAVFAKSKNVDVRKNLLVFL